jgi:hypothetical protein
MVNETTGDLTEVEHRTGKWMDVYIKAFKETGF